MTVYRLMLTFYITIHTWLYLVLSLSHYILRSGHISASTCNCVPCVRSLNLCQPPYLGFGLHALVVVISILETWLMPITEVSGGMTFVIHESSPPCQIGSELNLTLIKLLVLVVSFTGVFRTTCVPEEGEPVEPGELDKPR